MSKLWLNKKKLSEWALYCHIKSRNNNECYYITKKMITGSVIIDAYNSLKELHGLVENFK